MYKRFFKRLLDILISLISLILLSPVLLILAILVRVKLGSPIIFKQRRPGKDEKIFTLYKFRSMSDKRDENGKLLPDKERLTKFGKILRKSSLDELPELINIIKGEMSLVGPRPLAVQYLPYYNGSEKHRHDVRPGLTGLAQINGRNDLSWEDRFKLDLDYIDNISLINDVKIFFKTFYKVIKKADVVVSGTGTVGNFDDYRRNQYKQAGRFFVDRKFNRANTAVQGHMGTIMMDDEKNPNVMVALVGRNCFIDGNDKNISYVEECLKNLDKYYKVIIANEEYYSMIENIYKDRYEIASRYTTKKTKSLDEKKLKGYAKTSLDGYEVKMIDPELVEKIKNTDSYVTNIMMSDNYEENGIGFCAINKFNGEISGIATSSMVYDDGIEVNVKVADNSKGKGVATVLCSNLVLECIKENKYPYWDAFNKESLKLAQKLGYELGEEYRTYKINWEG